MSDASALKTEILSQFSKIMVPSVEKIMKASSDARERAKLVNNQINETREDIGKSLGKGEMTLQDEMIILEYCTAVSYLEYRNRVWQYEYMALSRRMGELWERFCKVAWDHPVRKDVQRVASPMFEEVLKRIHGRLESAIPKTHLEDFKNLIGLIDPINMAEDEVFTLGGKLHVIDFKSGFGSNEKGNTLRLLAVGRAYKLYDPEVVLLFLVRQKENNNYLNRIRSSKLWEVHNGPDAYKVIDKLTGSSIHDFRSNVIDFKKDLSKEFWKTMDPVKDEVAKYFDW
jgi:hypothetical protein